jgi:DGQHR domain-containing protein
VRIKAFSIKQRGARGDVGIYVSSLPAIELIERHALDRWTPESTGGYQRLPAEGRFGKKRGSIERYLLRELGCFPTSILLNVRGELDFEATADLGWCSLGDLEFGDDERLWLIDGQHKVEALRRAMENNAEFEQYPVIVSILRFPRRFDELMYFYLVNRRQRGVPTDLVYRHLQRMLREKGAEWLYEFEGRSGLHRGLATEIVDRLNDDPKSSWHGRTRRVTEERREEHIIRDQTIIRSVADVLRKKAFSGMPLPDLADLLIDYWNAVSKIYPGAFEDPRPHTLLGTPGVSSLHMLFPFVYGRCVEGGVITEERMLGVLGFLLTETPDHDNSAFRGSIDLRFWSKEHGPDEALTSNKQSIAEPYENLRKKIELAEEA